MTLTEFLFSITFVCGVIQLLTYTKLWQTQLAVITKGLTLNSPKWFTLLGYWIFYFSLFYQSYFWAKHFNII